MSHETLSNDQSAQPLDGYGHGLVIKNAAWLLAARLVSQGSALLFSILLARRLGEAGLGEYAFITSVIYLGNLTSTFGTDMLIMRELSARRNFGVIANSLVVQVAISIAFIGAVMALAPWLPNQTSEVVSALRVFSLSLLPAAVYSVSSAALRGLERMEAFTWLNGVQGAALVGLGWFFVQPSSSAVTVAWLLLAVNLVSAFFAAWMLTREAKGARHWKLSNTEVLKLVASAAPIALLGFVGVLYQRAGVLLLGIMAGSAATGVFSAAWRVVEAAKLGHFALLGALFPAMSRAAERPSGSADRLMNRSLAALLALAATLSFTLFFAAKPLVLALFGADFIGTIEEMRVLAWLLVPVTATHYYSLRLLAAKREKEILLGLVVSLCVLCVAAISGMPAWGVRAVSTGLVAAESIQALLLLYLWRRTT